jgi:enoyl-[acyl-carrier-protein] reductase (NADH)
MSPCRILSDCVLGGRARRSLVSVHDVGVAIAFLAHDAVRLITAETLYDGGYHIIG